MAVLIPEIGHAALLVALGLAVYGALAAVRAAATARPVWLQSARNAAAAHFLLAGRIFSILRMEPGARETYGPMGRFRYALEARAGFFKERGVTVGNALVLEPTR